MFADAEPTDELPGVTEAHRHLLLAPIPGEDAWFQTTHERGLPDLVLREVSPTGFQLIRPFRYQRPGSSEWHTIFHDPFRDPAHPNNSTNFASVPTLLWSMIASYGHQTRAAIIHDQFFDNPRTRDRVSVDEANLLFRSAMQESGVPLLRRWIMWTAVDAAGRLRTGGGRLTVLVQVVSAILFAGLLLDVVLNHVGWSDTTRASPWLFLIVALSGIAAAPKAWGFTVLGAITMLTPLLVAAVFATIQWSLEMALHVVRRDDGPRPRLSPTVRAPM